MNLFVGWDVGAWNCDRGKSQDALSVLTGTSLETLQFASRPWRANLRKHLVEEPCPSALLKAVGISSNDQDVVVAIDTR